VQDLPRVDAAIQDGTLFRAPAFTALVAALKASGGRCHLMGLVSPGGVHAHQNHLAALARELTRREVPVLIHAFLDGRDTPPRSARDHVAALANELGLSAVAIATVSGRYYAMDRDRRWERVALAYAALVEGKGKTAASADEAIARSYRDEESDEFVRPTAVGGYAGARDGDAILMANFRADRAREILSALLEPAFAGFPRARTVRFAAAAGLVSYSSELDRRMSALLPDRDPSGTLGEVLAHAGLAQLRIAETEKYAHVTFFFNGGIETPFAGEERILVPSPKVATYDLKPEMAAVEVTDRLVAAIESGRFDFILVNYANADMVGHTGRIAAAIKAVETVDRCLGRLADAVAAAGGTLFVTADHGNAEQMFDPDTRQAHTAHTTEFVPAILIHPPAAGLALRDGRLADVAPTLLALLGLAQPREMTGRSLLTPAAQAAEARRVRA
jgi:2,3-bisphosphoglycerate-independent phosphoglycerate mutase